MCELLDEFINAVDKRQYKNATQIWFHMKYSKQDHGCAFSNIDLMDSWGSFVFRVEKQFGTCSECAHLLAPVRPTTCFMCGKERRKLPNQTKAIQSLSVKGLF